MTIPSVEGSLRYPSPTSERRDVAANVSTWAVLRPPCRRRHPGYLWRWSNPATMKSDGGYSRWLLVAWAKARWGARDGLRP